MYLPTIVISDGSFIFPI